jgi:hypothetical protein
VNSRPVNDPDRQKPGGIDLLAPQAKRWNDVAWRLMDDPDAPLPEVSLVCDTMNGPAPAQCCDGSAKPSAALSQA